MIKNYTSMKAIVEETILDEIGRWGETDTQLWLNGGKYELEHGYIGFDGCLHFKKLADAIVAALSKESDE